MGRALWIAFTAIFASLLLYLAFVGNREQVVRVTSALPRVLNGLTALVERISLPNKANSPKVTEPDTSRQKAIVKPDNRPATTPVALANVEYGLDGQLVLTGKAAPGSPLDFFINGEKVEPQSLEADGEWKLVVPEKVPTGQHRLEISVPAQGTRPRTIVVMTFVKAGAEEIAAVAASRQITGVNPIPAPFAGISKKNQVDGQSQKSLRQTSSGFSKLAGLAQSQSVRRDVNPLGELLPGMIIGDGPLLATPQSEPIVNDSANGENALVPEIVIPAPIGQNIQPQLVSPRPEVVVAKKPDTKKPAYTGYRKVTVRPGQGLVVVQPGNTLWDLAISIYGSSRYYKKLYRANRRLIKDPRLIFPGQVIYAPDANPPTHIEPRSPPQWSPPQ